MCKVINIEDIEKSENKEIKICYDDYVTGIKSEGKIKANLIFLDLGEYIKVTGNIVGNAILECDLCLEEYLYPIDIIIDEMFAKTEYINDSKQEIELKENGFIIDLNGEKEINIEDLLYQFIILDFPNKKVCDINCNGGDIFIRDDNSEMIDPRMSVFKNIQINK